MDTQEIKSSFIDDIQPSIENINNNSSKIKNAKIKFLKGFLLILISLILIILMLTRIVSHEFIGGLALLSGLFGMAGVDLLLSNIYKY
ncbi:hypothetical protein GMMP1_140104 [Candidatus Magnetomoraceae bacterium gMMP-1]